MSITMPGLEAHNPLGFLAALGVLSLAADVYDGASLSWSPQGASWAPVLTGSGLDSEDAVLAALEKAHAARDLDAELGWAKDLLKLDRPQLRELLRSRLAAGDGPAARLVAACTAELPLRRSENCPYTPFRLIPVRGRARFLTSARAESAINKRGLRPVLFEPWTYHRKANTLGLDPGARRQARALMADAPTDDGAVGVPGSVLLGLRGLPFFAMQTTRTGAQSPGWIRRDAFIWPIWNRALTEPAARMLLGAPWLAARDDSAVQQLQAHYVVARYRALRVPTGRDRDGALLTWGESVD